MLGVSRASAGEMLKRLEADGLVERGEHKEAMLTAAGRARAEHVVRKHRMIERLLTDFMGYTPPRRTFTPTSSATRSPTTWSSGSTSGSASPTAARTAGPSIPCSSRRRTASSSRSRARAGRARDDRAARRARRRAPALVLRRGPRPRRRLELGAAEPAAGQFRVKLDGGEQAIGEKAAAGLFVRAGVRPDSPCERSARAVTRRSRPGPRGAERRALSVRSQVKSWSSRPKWPYAAVFA